MQAMTVFGGPLVFLHVIFFTVFKRGTPRKVCSFETVCPCWGLQLRTVGDSLFSDSALPSSAPLASVAKREMHDGCALA